VPVVRILFLRGARTIRTLSARYIADLQDHWEIHGKEALDEYRHKFVDRYVEPAASTSVTLVEARPSHEPPYPFSVVDHHGPIAPPRPARLGL
jgi:hypothetical protein